MDMVNYPCIFEALRLRRDFSCCQLLREIKSRKKISPLKPIPLEPAHEGQTLKLSPKKNYQILETNISLCPIFALAWFGPGGAKLGGKT